MFGCDVCMLLALQHLAETSDHEVVRSQARGALWILEGKEQQMPPVSSEVSSTPAGTYLVTHLVWPHQQNNQPERPRA